MINIISTPVAIHNIICKRTDESEETFIYIDLDEELHLQCFEEPSCSAAKICVVYDVVPHETIEKGHFATPKVQESMDFYIAEHDREKISSSNPCVQNLSPHHKLILIIER